MYGEKRTRRVEHPARAGCGYTEAHRRFALDRLYPSSLTYTDLVLSENLFECEGGRGRPAQVSTVFSAMARTLRNFRLHEMPAKAVKQVEEATSKRMRILDQDGSVFGAPNKHDLLRLSVVQAQSSPDMPMPSYDPSQFPRASAPALPIPDSDAFTRPRLPPPASVLSLPYRVATYSGRHAIALAMTHAGLRPGDSVLLPAYHCLGMVEPLRQAGLIPIYYPLCRDLTIHLSTLERLASVGARALVVVRYFGFVIDLAPIRSLADRLGLTLIEDCAHACFGGTPENPVGSTGDYAIASTMKFFPLPHGGLLASGRRDLSDIRLQAPPLPVELKAAVNALEQGIDYGRFGMPGRVAGIFLRARSALAWRGSYRQVGATAEDAPRDDCPEYAMDPRWLDWHASRVSTFLRDRTKIERLIERRRTYYLRYLTALSGRSDCRPLFDALPPGTVPQVFPLHVSSSLDVFVALKRQGVPIVRFGEFLDTPVTADLCPVSVDYSEHVLQFPCHQALRESEVDWILERLIAALDDARAKRRPQVGCAV